MQFCYKIYSYYTSQILERSTDFHICAIYLIMRGFELVVCLLACKTMYQTILWNSGWLLFICIMTVFGYWNPTGFIPTFCLIKTLCSVGNWRIDDQGRLGMCKWMQTPKKRCISLIWFSNIKNSHEQRVTLTRFWKREQKLYGNMAKENWAREASAKGMVCVNYLIIMKIGF